MCKAAKLNSPFYGIDGQGWFLRYAAIRGGDAFDETMMTTWVRQAAALPGWDPQVRK